MNDRSATFSHFFKSYTQSTSMTIWTLFKLLSVNTEYKLLKDGRIDMEMTLGPNESKKVEVIFEVSYAKEMKILY